MSNDFENETSKDIGVLIGEMKSVKEMLQSHVEKQENVLTILQSHAKEIERIKTTAKVVHTIFIGIMGIISWISGVFSHIKSGQ